MKKLYALLGSAFASAAVFAEGNALDTALVSVTGDSGVLGQLETSMTNFVTSALPVVAGIGAVFMAFWLGRMVFGLVKKWANSGK